MPDENAVVVGPQMKITDVRPIAASTAIVLLIGPAQSQPWAAAKRQAEVPTKPEWNHFAITQSTRTDNPLYEEYAATIYCKPHPDYPTIQSTAASLLNAWQRFLQQPDKPDQRNVVASRYADLESTLQRYFDNDPYQVINDNLLELLPTEPPEPDPSTDPHP